MLGVKYCVKYSLPFLPSSVVCSPLYRVEAYVGLLLPSVAWSLLSPWVSHVGETHVASDIAQTQAPSKLLCLRACIILLTSSPQHSLNLSCGLGWMYPLGLGSVALHCNRLEFL